MSAVEHPCVLAIDIGSSAVRAALVDSHGHCPSAHREGRTEAHSGLLFDAEDLWRKVLSVVAMLGSESLGRVHGVGVTSHIGTVLVDASLHPVGSAAGWADQSGVDLFSDVLGDKVAHYLDDLGKPVVTGGPLPALLALRESDLARYRSVRHVLSVKDFIVSRFTGTAVADVTSAGYSLASSVAKCEWNKELIRRFDIDPALFPAQSLGSQVVGSVVAEEAQRLGLPPVPVVAGGPDGTVGASFVLGTDEQAVADVAGTTDVLVRLVREPGHSPVGAVVNPYVAENYWAIGGATGMTGGAVSHWSELTAGSDPAHSLATVQGELADLPPGTDGLRVSPLLSGSRFPRWNPRERGEVSGMTAGHGRAQFLHAAQEGAAYIVREGLERLATGSLPVPERVILAGGASRSRLWAQMRADVLGREVLVCPKADASLFGTAVLTMVGVGMLSSLDKGVEQVRGPLIQVDPNSLRSQAYESLYQSWRSCQDHGNLP